MHIDLPPIEDIQIALDDHRPAYEIVMLAAVNVHSEAVASLKDTLLEEGIIIHNSPDVTPDGNFAVVQVSNNEARIYDLSAEDPAQVAVFDSKLSIGSVSFTQLGDNPYVVIEDSAGQFLWSLAMAVEASKDGSRIMLEHTLPPCVFPNSDHQAG